MKKNFLAVWTSQVLAAAMVIVCGFVVASCTDEAQPSLSRSVVIDDPVDPSEGYKRVVIDDETEKITAVIDGDEYTTNLRRSIKALDRREVVVPNFDGQDVGASFSRVQGEEKYARQDGKFLVYGRETVYTKMVSVGGETREVSYTLYQERAVFTQTSHDFAYVNWSLENATDNFSASPISTMEGKNELDYTNEIKTTYLNGYVQNANEVVAWFSGDTPKVIDHYEVINAVRNDYPTYTSVMLEKVAVYSDGSKEPAGKFSANLPIDVKPLTNWVLNVETLGTYTSGAFSGTEQGRNQKTAEKFFVYNQYVYRYANTVAGKENALSVSVPNDIVFNDGDVEYKFNNTSLNVHKGSEATTFSSETSSNKVYKYNCVANVVFGASQSVNLPGTVNVKKAQEPEVNHEHGKIKAVYFTSTPNENRSYYKSVCVIQFEDGYRSVGMADNGANSFEFSMSSTRNGVNSAVYDGRWMPSIAEDNTGAKCMIWRNEGGVAKRTLDFVTATAQRWNNGHNTVVDVRRKAQISSDGYSVTLYLNGNAGQTLKF